MHSFRSKTEKFRELLQVAKLRNLRVKKEILEWVGKRLGLNEKEIRRSFNRVEKELFVIPKNEFDRFVLIHRLFIIIRPEDQKNRQGSILLLCRNIGLQLGIHPTIIEDLIELRRKEGGNSTPVPVNDLIKLFKKFHN